MIRADLDIVLLNKETPPFEPELITVIGSQILGYMPPPNRPVGVPFNGEDSPGCDILSGRLVYDTATHGERQGGLIQQHDFHLQGLFSGILLFLKASRMQLECAPVKLILQILHEY